MRSTRPLGHRELLTFTCPARKREAVEHFAPALKLTDESRFAPGNCRRARVFFGANSKTSHW